METLPELLGSGLDLLIALLLRAASAVLGGGLAVASLRSEKPIPYAAGMLAVILGAVLFGVGLALWTRAG